MNAKETWTSVWSQNFTVIGNTSEKKLRDVAIKLEQFRRAYSIIFRSDKVESPIPSLVLVFNSDDSFSPFKPLFNGKKQDRVAGYFLRRSNANYIALNTGVHGMDPFDLIFHEYGHFLIENNIHRAPVWLNEGLAEFYSTFEPSDDEQKIRLGAPILRHVATLRNETYIPLRTLINVDYRSPYYHESNKAGIFYAESWVLVHYLMLGNHRKREKQFADFVAHWNPNESTEDAFKQFFQLDLDTLDKELYTYINGFTMPGVEYTLSKKLNYNHELKAEVLTEAESQYCLADLLLAQGRLKEAQPHLQKSTALDSKLTIGNGCLAVLRAKHPRNQSALNLLKALVEGGPNKDDSAIEQYNLYAGLKSNFGYHYPDLFPNSVLSWRRKWGISPPNFPTAIYVNQSEHWT